MLKLLVAFLFYAAVNGAGIESFVGEQVDMNAEEISSEFVSGVDNRKLNNRPNIAKLVENNHRLDTLEAALEATGLDSTLKGSGPFTVFAPTDAVSLILLSYFFKVFILLNNSNNLAPGIR